MHKHLKSVVAALLISSPLMAMALDEQSSDTAPTTPAATSQAAPAQDKAMSEQMQKMRAAHEKMAAAKTPAERQIAMQEGMATMKDSMGMMHKNCEGMSMGKGMSGSKDGPDQMMGMMMKMMDQQSSMMKMPMSN